MTLGEKLKQTRVERNLSQTDVAEYLNLTRQSISKWENNNGYPDLDNLVRLSEFYEVSIDELLKENQELKEKISDNKLTISGPKKKLKYLKNGAYRDEGLALLIISLLSSLISPFGLLIVPLVLKKNKATNTFHKLVIVASIMSLLINVFILYGHLGNVFHWGGPSSVEYLGINR